MEDEKIETYKDNLVQGGTVNPLKAMKKKGKEDIQELKNRLVETHSRKLKTMLFLQTKKRVRVNVISNLERDMQSQRTKTRMLS